jgi:UDP-N-acetylglucosamine--N-acetylmuramyl-(pentapeptide) pyrophosphoryl-undecaprenol N-acetylglucosamine transferase
MKAPETLKVMVVAAGSGGHVFPAVGFCQELKAAYGNPKDITFVTTQTESRNRDVPEEFRTIRLKINRSLAGAVKCVVCAFSLIGRIHPDVIFGFGGYMTVPFIVLGSLFGKKTLIHEQNVVPGRANRFFGFFAKKIVISFEKTRVFFKNDKKVFLARYPLRASLKRVDKDAALDFFGFQRDLLTLLVMGGSQGARRINEFFLAALKEGSYGDKLQVIHLCGQQDLDATQKAYQVCAVRHKSYAFLNEMRYAYSAADFVIARSGAGSLFEIMSFGLPSILIPYPYAGAHQVANAKFLAEKGAAILLEDAKMSVSLMRGLLDIMVEDAMRRKTMGALSASLYASSENLTLKDLVACERGRSS